MSDIILTEPASKKVASLLEQDGRADIGLRIKIIGGGCSGLSYSMELDTPQEKDKVFNQGQSTIIVDRKSFIYLRGMELDYIDMLSHSGFKFNNPNVKRTCGCGSSFSV